jgi:sulfur carrier protein
MKVFVEQENKHLELEAETGQDLLDKLSISHQNVIITRNNEVILPEDNLNEDDSIEILSVISGG